jgi:hypothetical protein
MQLQDQHGSGGAASDGGAGVNQTSAGKPAINLQLVGLAQLGLQGD